jgi:ubiquitin-protein ligase
MRRVYNEYRQFQEDGLSHGIYVAMDDNAFRQYVMVVGMHGPYKGTMMFFQVDIPADTPFKPPLILVKNPYPGIMHPQMLPGRHVCYIQDWSPAFTTFQVFAHIVMMLDEAPLLYRIDSINASIDEILEYNEKINKLSMSNTLEHVLLPALLDDPKLNPMLKLFKTIILQHWHTNRTFYLDQDYPIIEILKGL